MRDNKGFTLIEVLAVVVLLGILASIATVSVTKYRKNVDEKEIASLKQTIKASFDNYRINHNVVAGNSTILDSVGNEKEIIKELNFDGGNVLRYAGKKCNISSNSKVLYVVNGTYIDDFSNDEDRVKYKVCQLDKNSEGEFNICATDTTGPIPSQMETVCIKLSCDGGNNFIINDFEDSNSICYKDITGIN